MAVSMRNLAEDAKRQSQQGMTAFNALLNSMRLSADDKEKMVRPMRDEIRKELWGSHRSFCWGMFWVTLLLMIIFVMVILVQTADPGPGVYVAWGIAAALCGLILFCVWKSVKNKLKQQEGYTADVLLYAQFMRAENMDSVVDAFAPRRSTILHGGMDEEETSMRPFGCLAAKLTVVLMVVLQLAFAGGAAICNTTLISREGVLISWRSPVGQDGVAEIPEGVTEIGTLAFENNEKVRRIIVPDTVTTVESGAFRGCVNLEEIVLPDTVTLLGAEVFSGCRSLRSFTVPAGVTEIRAETFKYCTSLQALKLHPGVTTLHARAFQYCSSLTGIELPEGLTELPTRCFDSCDQLTSIVIPASVKEIGSYCFTYCRGLAEVTFLSDMPEGKIGEGAFQNCKSLTRIVVPAGVVRISAAAFNGCAALEEITLPASLPDGKIGEYMFYGCTSMKSIVIPEGVVKISGHAFEYCRQLEEVIMPETVRELGSSAFRNCSSLRDIYLPEGCYMEYNTFKDSPTNIHYGVLKETEYQIVDGCATLVKWGRHSEEENQVQIPAEYEGVPVTAIGESAFEGREEIRTVKLPDTITVIGKRAFSGCTALTDVSLPESLTELGELCFENCKALKRVTIPAGVKKIGLSAFRGSNLEQGVVMAQSMPGLEIGYMAFADTKLKSIVLPQGVEVIQGFTDCKELMAVQIQEGVKKIGARAFKNCSSLSLIELPDYIEWGIFETGAFYGCDSLEEFAIPEGVFSLAETAFYHCDTLRKVTLPQSMSGMSIGDNAFTYCVALREVCVPEGSVMDLEVFPASCVITYYTPDAR